MLISVKQLYGNKLGASDGEIGHVKDFYFDDQQWALRYVVFDTGAWLPRRLILLPPHALLNFCEAGDSMLVDLSRQEIEDSPSIEPQKLVSRQYEEEYHRYYEWPPYWNGGGSWGLATTTFAPSPNTEVNRQTSADCRPWDSSDPHLRSAKSLIGYQIQSSRGDTGHVCDFVLHDKTWAMAYLVVEPTRWFAGKEIVIPSKHVERISYVESKVYVK